MTCLRCIFVRYIDIAYRKAKSYNRRFNCLQHKLHLPVSTSYSSYIIEYYVENAEKFLKATPVPDSPGCVIATEPIGVILAIEPWNFPYYHVARVIGPQIVAGNVVIVKHAPTVPQCALSLAQLFKDTGAPDGIYTNIFSSIPQVNTLIDDFRIRGVTLAVR
jgi:succinate-semialdehyde dehydrogenase/glutarate-semialdehyde dehydrogenase